MANSRIVDRDGNHIVVTYVGKHCLPCFSGLADRLPRVKNWLSRPDDIFIIAYPSSGTHWLWEVANMVLRGKAERIPVEKESCMLENVDLDQLEPLPSPRVLNGHMWSEMLPDRVLNSNRIIFIVRNPKDIAVSWYNHNLADVESEYQGFFPAFYELFREGKGGDWFEYNLQWWEWSKDRENVLWLTYEEAKRNLPSIVRKIAKFLDVECDEELSAQIADQCNIKKMKKDKHHLLQIALRENMSFYRKGQVGDWKNWFTVAQNEDFDKMFQERMKDTDLEIEFDI